MKHMPGLAAVAMLFLAGCGALRMEQAIPEPSPPPPAWRNQPKEVRMFDQPWWEGFADDQLSSLVERAIESNQDLAVATSHLASAHALAKLAAAERRPFIGVDASTARQRTPKTRVAGSSEDATPAYAMPITTNTHWGGLLAYYDIDVSGRLSHTENSTLKEAQAAGWDLDAARLALVHAVVTTYLESRYTDAMIRSATERKLLHEELILVEQTRVQAGLTPTKAVREAETLLSATNRDLFLLNKDAEVSRAQLAILTGASPQAFSLEFPQQRRLPLVPGVPPDLPAEVLAHRPDLRAAWARVEAAGINVERARLERFPKLTLTSALGFASNALSSFLSKDALTWILGLHVSSPLFDGGRIEARVEQGQANLDGAIATYRQSVLVALKDIEQTLAALNSADQLRTEARHTLDRALRAEREAELEYAAGRIGRGTLAKERIQRNLAENALLDSERSFATASARVFLSFGKSV